ncbi:integral membrane sensor signal transduction histidine kinase [Solidesulfovibrio fructosivorans JJ]]|uniref:histidine kinase n=1 Tax=Solidesulfovibrio fructosivorans JJ] TaxID=596151 RepID=E1JY24_SOLFR|nr:ATP-binding protein [Solidesulfovibrio fructosivorans]EFL50762.1 integral membrane sensor signal transduction histidine kinase [Solidesulfovibrio fructosivorans JJ]]
MISLRRRLFAILVAATGIIWLCGILWIFVGAKAELEHVLDTRLQEAARMVNSLVARSGPALAATASAAATSDHYERQLSCQIWSFDGRLIARSGSAPDVSLTDKASGFSDHRIQGEYWRVYTIDNPAKGVRVMIGDRLGQRDQLARDLVKGLSIPAILMLPLLGGLIWLSLGRGLRPLLDMAVELKSRDVDDMRPLRTQHAPAELLPLAKALNSLFAKVETARRHERDITAFAAHELRTPLAGLKTHAQIAMATDDPGIRQGALRHILLSVDRSTRLVRQLLTLAKLESGPVTSQTERICLGDVLEEIGTSAQPSVAQGITVRIDPALRNFTIAANRDSLAIALRNLHENALQHSPAGGTVVWNVTPDGRGIQVEDEGPGMPPEEILQATQRFFRGKQQTPTGCGLGLAIVEAVLQQMGGWLVLENREGGRGLRAMAVLLPAATSCP